MLRALVFENPLLVKHTRARLRRQHTLPLIAAVVVTCGLIMWPMAMFAEGASEDVAGLFMFLLVMQAGILLLAGTYRVATDVSEAQQSLMLDFHRISPQKPLAITLGFLFGSPIREYVLFACTLPFSMALAYAGNVSALSWLALMLALISTAVLYHSGALVAAIALPAQRGSAVGILFLAFILQSMAIPAAMEGIPLGHLTIVPTAAIALDPSSAPDLLPPGVPSSALFPLLLALLHQIPLVIFLCIAATRKLRDDQAPAFAKPTALLFYAILAAMLAFDAIVRPRPAYSSADIPWAQFSAYLLFGAGLLLVLISTPARARFAKGIRHARKLALPWVPPWDDAAVNWASLPLFALVLLFGVLASAVIGTPLRLLGPQLLAGAAVAAFTLLYFGYAKQVFSLAYPKNGDSYFGLLLFLLWVFPLLAGLILTVSSDFGAPSEEILAISPLAGIGIALSDPIRRSLPTATGVALLASIIPALGFAWLSSAIARRAEAELQPNEEPPTP